MNRKPAAVALAWLLAAAAAGGEPPRIQVVADSSATRVEISIDGKPFTAYVYREEWKKPALYPIRTASGTPVTRGWPVEPRANERADHPHHVGLWFNYGDVNGLDFWNNSTATGPDRAAGMDSVVHKRVLRAQGGDETGELAVELAWVDSSGTPLLAETARFVFRGDAHTRAIDRITTLTAAGRRVVLGDNKEGLLGLRVARGLEQPSDAPVVLVDNAGRPRAREVNHDGVTGRYMGSDGQTGDQVWGTRGPWTLLAGRVEGEAVTLAILDHPSNPGYPTYWHARGYGLFAAANNLGRQVFDPAQPTASLTLLPGNSVTFRHRLLILGGTADAARMDAEHRKFAAQK